MHHSVRLLVKLSFLHDHSKPGGILKDGFGAAAVAARKGADYTATLSKANAGRAAYINAEQLIGHTDPGAEAVARLFEQLQDD